MREILFRGKPKYDGEYYFFSQIWKDNCKDGFVCGSLVVDADRYYICVSAMRNINTCINNGMTSMIEVIPETVGQFTGLTDKNGKKIFEGDIVRDLTTYLCHKSYFERGYKGEENYEKYRKEAKPNVVSFISENFGSCGCCFDSFVGSGFASFDVDLTCCEVIGNIHDNPELLENP